MTSRLAEIVVAAELLEESKVGAALDAAKRAGEPLAVQLVRRMGVDELALVQALVRALRLPIVDLSVEPPDPEALREVPQDLAIKRRVLPLSVDLPGQGPRTMRVAMVDPTDADAVADLELTTGCRLMPFLVGLTALEEALGRAYRGHVTAILKRGAKVPFGPPSGGGLGSVSAASAGTAPHHRLEDEASLELRLRALLDVLDAKGVVLRAEYLSALKSLLQRAP